MGHADEGKFITDNMRPQSVFYKKRLKGSLTIETALVLPFFLFGMLLLLSLLDLMNFYMTLDQALYSESKLLSERACVAYDRDKNRIYSDLLGFMDEGILKRAPVIGQGYGIDVGESDLDNREILTLCAGYTTRLPYDLTGLFSYRFDQRITVHTFTGYDRGLHGQGDGEDNEYVYMTPNGSVYHTSPDCTHIKLRIRETDKDSLLHERNDYGAKYKACEHCHSRLTDPLLYITPEGERYHNSLNCSGLTRTIRVVKLSDIPGVPQCSRCKGR
ncbi:MAG: hypothetical protein K6G22_02335 [Lachnospiraceae bacterium]|nr:hypothetical protein [Lachnospiraceae bacterium]